MNSAAISATLYSRPYISYYDSIYKKANSEIFVQVINRDLSIAVLRYFVQQRREEIAAGAIRRIRKARPAPLPAAAAAAAQLPPASEAAAAAAPGQPAEALAAAATEQPSRGIAEAAEAPSTSGRAATDDGALDPDIRILEGLAASGLRSIRYALEVKISKSHFYPLVICMSPCQNDDMKIPYEQKFLAAD